MDLLAALGSGALAGLGVAMPLGAISVLLIGEGVARGFRAAAPAGLAVGLVDTVYCALAVVLGVVAAPAIAAWGSWPRAVGGCALIVIAAFGLWRAWRRSGDGDGSPPAGSGWRLFGLFLGLTAINPATLVYFAAITVGLAHLLGSAAAGGLFVVGVGVASISWQLLVVAAGGLLRGRTTPRARRITALVGNVIVAGLGMAMLLSL